MTTQDRKALLLRAQQIRQEQAKIRESIREGRLDPTSVLIQRNTNNLMGRIRLTYLLMSIKGIGKFKAQKLIASWGLPHEVRLEELELEQVIRIAETITKFVAEQNRMSIPQSEPREPNNGKA
jgi:5'-3' exonuclease